MASKAKSKAIQPTLLVDSEVVRQIRQHARTSPQAEICGILIGDDRNGTVKVEASIMGQNAEEAGAHVTFTQDTWQHIYEVKDREFPEQRIVGWYHSHPGFGVFLSDHDTFIHQNFFSSPGQVAWVFDPHSDEEGCFGWVDGEIERLKKIAVVDLRGGERAGETGKPGLQISATGDNEVDSTSRRISIVSEESDDSLERLVTTFFSHIAVLLIGFLLAFYFFPRVVVVPVAIDPNTGLPLAQQDAAPAARPSATPAPSDGKGGTQRDSQSSTGATKGNNAQSR
jgi:proteasome lid subunit RPN8/RPN11